MRSITSLRPIVFLTWRATGKLSSAKGLFDDEADANKLEGDLVGVMELLSSMDEMLSWLWVLWS